MKRLVLCTIIAVAAGQVVAAGHFELAWFRQWGYTENAGNHSMQIWVFDEYGNKMGNVHILDQYGIDHGWYTAPDGHRCEVPLWPENDWGFQCTDGAGSTSDVTPVVTTAYWYGDYGHYSYDCGFIYKADASSPLDADDTIIGGVPQRDSHDPWCPYTASMVYASQDPNDLFGDSWALGDFVTEHHQTFVATGINRLMGVFLFGVLPANQPCQWAVDIHEGGPEGPIIFSKSQPYPVYFGMPLPFAVDDCPVSPGQTYTITMKYASGCNAYHVGNNYAGGMYYADGTAHPDQDMYGFAWGVDAGVGTYGILRGTVSDDLGPLSGVVVTLQPGNLQRVTDANGAYTYGSLTPGTYDVIAETPGYTHGESLGNVVVADQTTRVDFLLQPLVNELRNGGFELGTDSAWEFTGDPPCVMRTGVFAVQAAEGDYMLGVAAPSRAFSGCARTSVTGQHPGQTYDAGVYFYTDSHGYGSEYPDNCKVRIGVDIDGGDDPAGVDVWSAWTPSYLTWSPLGVTYTATGTEATVFVEYSAAASRPVNRVFIDKAGVYNVAGGNPVTASEPGWFRAGWNLCSVPLRPTDTSAEAVFDDLVAAGNDLTNNLFKYQSGSGYSIYPSQFNDIDPGRGYWLHLDYPGVETMAARVADDPTEIALDDGWVLFGHPHSNPTPWADCTFTDGSTVPAWWDHIQDGKRKYRSDTQPAWSWTPGARTAIEWRVYIDSNGSTSTSQPRLNIRDGHKAELSYNPLEGIWTPSSSMTVTSGGVGRAVVMGNDEWHTVYYEYDATAQTWQVTVDGKMDDYHHMEGMATEETTSQYAQWGVLSSGSYCNMYTDYVVWGQDDEIGDWPAEKTYVANPLAPNLPNGAFPGWGLEGTTSGCSYSSKGELVKTLDEAAAAGWIEGMAYYYDASYKLVRTDGTGDDDSLRPWYGYWMLVNEPGLTMTIPK